MGPRAGSTQPGVVFLMLLTIGGLAGAKLYWGGAADRVIWIGGFVVIGLFAISFVRELLGVRAMNRAARDRESKKSDGAKS